MPFAKNVKFAWRYLYICKTRFSETMMKNVIITGANSGLGFETAKKIAKTSKEFRLILACRNVQKGNEAKEMIISESGNENVLVMKLDTASLEAVRDFAQDYAQSGCGAIHALLCNAGINGTHSGLTEDGFDLVFQTNHLGHFLLTRLLLPQMAPEGLVFATSSDMHDPPMGKFDWPGTGRLAHPGEELAKKNIRYSYSKLCNLYFIYGLAERLKQQDCGIKANAFNPGLMQTNFASVTKASMAFVKMSMPDRCGDLEKSSAAYARLVTQVGLVQESGLYYDRSINVKRSSPLSYDEANREELWAASSGYCGLEPDVNADVPGRPAALQG